MAFSKVMIIGNLGRDPEMRYTPNGRAVTEFSVAVTHRGREPADRRVGRPGDRLVPGDRVGRPCRAHGRGIPQGQPGVRGGAVPDPRVRRQGRHEADLARDHRRQRHRPRAERPRRGGVLRGPGRRLRPPGWRRSRRGGGGRSRRPAGARPTTPISTTCPSDPGDLTHAPRPIPKARRLLPRSASSQGLRVLRRQEPRSTTRRSTASAATCPSAPRSSRAARPARAPATSASWPWPSSGPATSRCSRTPPAPPALIAGDRHPAAPAIRAARHLRWSSGC